MERRCRACGSTALAAVSMSHGDREPPRPIQVRRLLGFGLLNAAMGQRLAHELPAVVPGVRVHHG
jgi:hypothetical protein